MSRLGIAFVLPYVGSNGIKVVNNEIGLDPNGVGELGALILNRTSVAGSAGTILSIWQDGVNGNDNIDILNSSGVPQQYLSYLGILVINALQTIKNNSSAPVISFDFSEAGITTDPTSGLIIQDANGNTYASIAASGL